ncbi:TPA: FibroRumin family radical SAM-modified Cys-rich RiPP [Proteus mirabilis]|nr:FibroRumin family radical SAM-modified Cys-rich RiPP [Proteus mirabilis]
MVATENQFNELFGEILDDVTMMARCACVVCNSCTCACSCRGGLDDNEIGWAE